MTDTLGLYIHIPFCRSRCRYCGFYSAAALPDDRFICAMLREMEEKGGKFSQDVDTVYFGGGTPSVLSEEQLTALMDGARRHFHIRGDAEITMEMNPCDMTDRYLETARALGINRLSVGIQARQDRLLRYIGRGHTAAEAESAVRRAYKKGFHNISADLMYDLPGQRPEDFERSLLWAMHLPITHLSVYGLILEEGTLFGQMAAQGRLLRPTEAESWRMYQDMCRIPRHYGFERYEISSFARNGFRSRHNQKYWRLDDYLGLGPAACSRIGAERRQVLPGTRRYIKALLEGHGAPEETARLTEREEMEEYCFLHLRMKEGIDLADFQARYGEPPENRYGEKIGLLKKEGLLTERSGHLMMTARGAALGNLVFEEFLLDQ